MVARLIDGRKVASDIKEGLKKEVIKLKAKGIKPRLAVIYEETDPLSKKYVALKKKACSEVGIDILIHSIQKATTQDALIKLIKKLNTDPGVNGIFLQFPLREGFCKKDIINNIAPEKDVDACNPYTVGRLILDEPGFIPCVSYGAINMLEAYGIKLAGKETVVVGGGDSGRSLALLLLRKNAAVTICSVKTPNLKQECLKADILCVEVGKAGRITADMIKEGATVIDMGMNVTQDGKVVGDIDFDSTKKRAAYITPVPGGMGPVTIAMLLHNTVLATKMQANMKNSPCGNY